MYFAKEFLHDKTDRKYVSVLKKNEKVVFWGAQIEMRMFYYLIYKLYANKRLKQQQHIHYNNIEYILLYMINII